MKRKILFVIVLIIGLVSCQNESINEPEENKINYASLVLSIKDTDTKELLSNIKCDINNKNYYSNSSGEINLDSVKYGNIFLNINDSNYNQFNDTIKIVSDTLITILLQKIRVDYFPYSSQKYIYFEDHYGGGAHRYQEGISTWEFTNKVNRNDTVFYSLIENLEYQNVIIDHNTMDTSFSAHKTKRKLDVFEYEGVCNIQFEHSYFNNKDFLRCNFSKYYSKTNNDTISLNDGRLILKKNVGLKYYRFLILGGHNIWNLSYKLIE